MGNGSNLCKYGGVKDLSVDVSKSNGYELIRGLIYCFFLFSEWLFVDFSFDYLQNTDSIRMYGHDIDSFVKYWIWTVGCSSACGRSAVSFDASPMRDSQPRGHEGGPRKLPDGRPRRLHPSMAAACSGEGFSPSAVVALRGPDRSLRGTDGYDSCASVSARSPRSRRRNLKTRGRDLEPGALF